MKIAYTAGKMIEGCDGVSRVMFKWDEYLSQKKIDHIFISGDIPPENNRRVPMYKVPAFPIPLYKEYQLSLPTQKSFDAILNNYRPDIIHINSPCPLACAALKYGKKHDIPVVATYHTHFLSYARYYKLTPLTDACWALYHRLYGQCEQLYVPSTPILEELERGGLRNLIHLPHGIDTSLFNESRFSDGWKSKIGVGNKFVVFYAGRLVWEKDLRVFAEVYAEVQKNCTNIAFVLAGNGPVKEELQQLMPEAVFLGQLNSEELAAAFASSDIFFFPSRTETFGNVILEAMACGTVPLCAKTGGAVDLIREGETGFLSHPDDIYHFSRIIDEMSSSQNRLKNISHNAATFAQTQSWENIIERMLSYYRSTISNRIIWDAA